MTKKITTIFLLGCIAALAIAPNVSLAGKTPSSLCYYTVPAISNVKRLPDTFPADGILNGELQIVAAKNEFEPASFVIISPEDIDKATLKASNLTCKAGTIPAANVDLKIVKCWYQGGTAWHSYFSDIARHTLVPELLLNDENLIKVDTSTKDNYLRVDYPEGTDYQWISNHRSIDIGFNAETTPVADAKTIQPFKLTANEFKQFWVTVKVPENAKADIYRGSIKLSPDKVSIPISVRVLPFELPKPMTNYDETREFYTLPYNGPKYEEIFKSSGSDKKHADKKMLALYENMRKHNVVNPRLGNYSPESENEFIRQLEVFRDSGCSTDTLFDPMRARDPAWLDRARGVPMAEQTIPESFTSMVDPAIEIIKDMFGHTNAYCYGWDEPAKWRVVAQRLGWKYLHDKGVKIYSTGKDSHLDYAGYNQDFMNCPGQANRERAAKWHAMGCRVTNYAAPHTGPENPDFVRRAHGLELFNANYDGIGNYKLYCYRWNDFREKYRAFNITYPTQDGVIDTIEWEGFREAIDDVRYATKLKSLARQAIATGTTDNIYAGRQALQWLDLLDVRNVDLNTTRLEMIDRILALSEFEGKSETLQMYPKKPKPVKGNAAVAKALIAKGKKEKAAPKGIKKWKDVLADKNISDKQYSRATFKLIEALAVKGKMDKATAATQAAASDAKLSAGDKLTAKLIGVGFAAGENAEGLKEKAQKAVANFEQSKLDTDTKKKALNDAAKIFMATRQYEIARGLAAMAVALYVDPPQEVYDIHYVKDAPSSVEGWVASDIVKDPKKREARFEPYDKKAAALLIYDVNAERAVGDDKVDADKKTAFYMAYDADGWSTFIECEDSNAEEAAAGLVGGGSLEMYFAPGVDECYYQYFVSPASGKSNTVEWSSPNRHYRPIDSYWKHDTGMIDNGFGVHVSIPWELVYDKLPKEGDRWPFNIIRWSRAGGMTWRGKVHNIYDFGVVRWDGLTDDTMEAIKRKILMKGIAKYRKAKSVAVAHWSDEVLGDPVFYNQKMVPVIERLDEMETKALAGMTSEDVADIYEKALPDWMEFKYLVSELRSEYLAKRLLAGTAE